MSFNYETETSLFPDTILARNIYSLVPSKHPMPESTNRFGRDDCYGKVDVSFDSWVTGLYLAEFVSH